MESAAGRKILSRFVGAEATAATAATAQASAAPVSRRRFHHKQEVTAVAAETRLLHGAPYPIDTRIGSALNFKSFPVC